jgi:hypothetical protein
MQRTRSRGRAPARNHRMARRGANRRTRRLDSWPLVEPAEPRIIRGGKLKTVSAFMLAFSLRCLSRRQHERP